MEEENQRNPEFNEESINAIKTSLMGPLAGIGDSRKWSRRCPPAVPSGWF
jgi:mannose/fructose/N-acetylgalactosamine-specific phosphotransferase system component IID